MKLGRFITGVSLLALSACGIGGTVVTMNETISLSDPGKVMSIIQASERVLTRRLAGLGVKGATVSVIPSGSGSANVSMNLPDTAAVEAAAKILSDPFTFEIKIDGGTIKNADGTEQTDWKTTGLNGSMLTWVRPVTSSAGDVGVELQFNDAGHQKLAEIFSGNKGKGVGVFVRDLLVSKLTIDSDEPSENIIISGIPSAKVAEIFADDVNVGLYTTFTPAP